MNTLQDIRDNKELQIWANPGPLQFSAGVTRLYIDDIIIRIRENKLLFNPYIFAEHIFNGEGVFLCNTMQKKKFIEMAKIHQGKIFVSDNKYLPNFISFIRIRHRKYEKTLRF